MILCSHEITPVRQILCAWRVGIYIYIYSAHVMHTPIPRVENFIDILGGGKFITMLDLTPVGTSSVMPIAIEKERSFLDLILFLFQLAKWQRER